MRRGVWHQFGHQSQTLAKDVLEAGVGVGVIVSPRDLRLDTAVERAEEFRRLGADVLLDPQFHVPGFTNENIATYNLESFRESVNTLRDIPDSDLSELADRLVEVNRRLGSSAVMAPAVLYEAGQREIERLNRRLFSAAQHAAEELGVPVLSTVVLGSSVMSSDETLSAALGAATAHNCDGVFLACEFEALRVPSSRALVERFLNASITIASAGKPVMHGYAGPMALLSFAVGAQAAAVGHFQNLWQFSRDRWGPTPAQGGGPQEFPPRRFFSSSLWGTIVYPDETALLSDPVARLVLTHSPFSGPVSSHADWKPSDSWRHLVYIVGDRATTVAAAGTPRACAAAACAVLDSAVALHADVKREVSLRDGADSYQAEWRDALNAVVASRRDDYDFFELLLC